MTATYADVLAAAEVLRGVAHVTPVMTSTTLDDLVNAEVFLKCENLQRTGAFKFRGAYNAISGLTDAEKAHGVLAYSSGNHAQAVAKVCAMLDVAATIVMPDNAPQIKRAATEGYGATVVEYSPATAKREDVAAELAAARGFTLIPPYDHAAVIAGQGTAALELHHEIPGLDALLVCCGGGGLLSGCAIATKGIAPDCRVIGVEPALADDATRSFHTRTLHTVENPPTIADGTRTPSLGKLTFPLVLEYVDDMVTVSEEAIKAAVRFAFYRLKLVVEPSGALGPAALLSGALPSATADPAYHLRPRIGIIVSGGNVDGPTMRRILAEGETKKRD